VVAVIPELALGDVAQLAGEGLLIALAQGSPGAKELTGACLQALGERGWEGDDDLAAQLTAALGDAPPPALRAVPVDLEELSWILEGDGTSGDGCLDLLTGEVWSDSAIENAEEFPDVDDSERWLYVGCEGSHEGYRDMEDFLATVEDDERADKLSIAVSGPGAFRRFRDVLERWPEDQWRFYAFTEERRRARARSWLVSAGVAAVPPALARTT